MNVMAPHQASRIYCIHRALWNTRLFSVRHTYDGVSIFTERPAPKTGDASCRDFPLRRATRMKL
jgi:hypothetical protein